MTVLHGEWRINKTNKNHINKNPMTNNIRRPFEKFVDWQQCAAVMQKVAVTVVSSCSGEGNVVVV
jgi:uncharacterized ParB-like nuclease family protein